MNSNETHMKGGGGRAMTTASATTAALRSLITAGQPSHSLRSYTPRTGSAVDFFNIHVTALRIFTRSSTDTTKNILITPQTEPQDV